MCESKIVRACVRVCVCVCVYEGVCVPACVPACVRVCGQLCVLTPEEKTPSQETHTVFASSVIGAW